MLSRYLLYGLSLCWTAFALNIPRHDAQRPLLSDQRRNQAQSHTISVTVEFMESEDDMERRFEIPLRMRVSPGTLYIKSEVTY
jgi:hypothetical protein